MMGRRSIRKKEEQFPWYLGDKGLERCILKMPKGFGETYVLKTPMLRLLVTLTLTFPEETQWIQVSLSASIR